ncbi:MAG TPA: aconitate hydratase AcnA [Planctomycetota bacterium]|jgi:aconitate hydratase|nr:aconitate hydratase AcnA [Planctomycetota bacterium]
MKDSFQTKRSLSVGNRTYSIASLPALEAKFPSAARLPYSLKILLENLLRTEDGEAVTAADIEALARWNARAAPSREIQFTPARVLLQDFTGVPAVVDLAAMRDAMKRMGGDPRKINPLQPVELVIDHSVQVDAFGTLNAFARNAELEFDRNRERYAFLRWGSTAFEGFRVVPPDTGIVHQVNLEHLARVVMDAPALGAKSKELWAFPDTLVGTDSHTTMINGLGVLGWGVGGIEAEAAMLGQPLSMLIPQVVGVRLVGRLPEGATATDLVLRVTEVLRKHGVVGKFVEFTGPGLAELPLADRATIANMAPEYGATCGLFPLDESTIAYLRLSGRDEARVALVEAYAREQGLFRADGDPEADYTEVLTLDLATIEPSLAGPKRPQDRVALADVGCSFEAALESLKPKTVSPTSPKAPAVARLESEGGKPAVAVAEPETERHEPYALVHQDGAEFTLEHGSVVIAAITSCTNTSNPSVMIAAGLLAKKAVEQGLARKPWVKTSLAPGSKVVTEYLAKAGLTPYLEQLGFHLVGYGCTTCIGNSGPLPRNIAAAIDETQLVVAAVLSGNRNFEGRVHAQVRANYLASPPLVVAFALAGRVDVDLTKEPLAERADGTPVFLKDVWPSAREVQDAIAGSVGADMFSKSYADVFAGDERWRAIQVPKGDTYAWDPNSTYVKHPPYFVAMPRHPGPIADFQGARVLCAFGDSITTDHISPAGSIKPTSPAGRYLQELGVKPEDFNSYGARRGNHEVMVRGTFANTRIRNKLVPGVEGGESVHLPDGERMSIYDAAVKYATERVPLIVLAGKEYGSGSSRDWAAKGPFLLGVRAVIAESFERIHRSNLVGMGILPLQFLAGETADSLGLTGREVYSIADLARAVEADFSPGARLSIVARDDAGKQKKFQALLRIDTPNEAQYWRHGGILQYVLRKLLPPVR